MLKQVSTIRIVLFFISSIMASGVWAQEAELVPEMVTDRPDATESAKVVPLGSLQIETGAFYESYEEGIVKQETYGYNTTLLRYGLLDNLELRLGWNFEEQQTALDGQQLDHVLSGFSPLLFGVKLAIAEEKNLMPEMGLLLHVGLPFLAATDFRPETTGVDFRFAFAHTINDRSSISYNLGAQWSDDSPEAAYIYTLSYGYSITEKIGAYAELYGDLPEDSKSNHYWDAGLTYLIANNFQLDATIGSSITKGQDILISTGISYRLPK